MANNYNQQSFPQNGNQGQGPVQQTQNNIETRSSENFTDIFSNDPGGRNNNTNGSRRVQNSVNNNNNQANNNLSYNGMSFTSA